MNYRRALWFAKTVGETSLVLGVLSALTMLLLTGITFDQMRSLGPAVALPTACMGMIGAAVYLLLGGFGYAVCAALHHYLFQALGQVDDESPGLGRDKRRRP